jgi:RND superfamily putative drug exporter
VGVGLAVAVLIDATLVRGVLVPAFLRLAGRANWWFPGAPPHRTRRGTLTDRLPDRLPDQGRAEAGDGDASWAVGTGQGAE